VEEEIQRRLERAGGRALNRDDPEFPPRLLALSRVPSVVYLAGLWNHPGPKVALVGARDASDDGIDVARGLAADLARRGVAVLSGLARGIDAAAHGGALDAGGKTGAVLGTPLDRCYPLEHRDLQREVAASLGLLTEIAPDAPVTAGTFATRNRLLAALADAVVVVQGRARSGALLTAETARRLGTPVGALPWDSRDPLGESPHALIRSGAASLLRGADDVMELLGAARGAVAGASERGTMLSASARAASAAVPLPLPFSGVPAPGERGIDAAGERLWRALRERPRPLDAAAREAELTIAEASAALVRLELAGRARRQPGGDVRRLGRV